MKQDRFKHGGLNATNIKKKKGKKMYANAKNH